MDPDFQAQLQRLQQVRSSQVEGIGNVTVTCAQGLILEQFRQSFAEQNTQSIPSSAQDAVPSGSGGKRMKVNGATSSGGEIENEPVHDPLIFPGLYSPSGFDMMGILVRVRTRPNPAFDIGNIDSSVALVLCDTALPDNPIVYCSEPFEVLTGYSSTEVLGKNCRFLQHPHASALNNVKGTAEVEAKNAVARAKLRDRIAKVQEAQVRLVNYKKGGAKFFNLLTIIPIAWDEGEVGKRYIVGFQAQDNALFR